MGIQTFILPMVVALPILCAFSANRRVDGWYPVADYPDNSIVGKPLA